MEISKPTTSKTTNRAESSSSEYDSDSSGEEKPTVVNVLNENYEDELETSLNTPKKHSGEHKERKSPLIKIPKSKLPVSLKGLMGEANLRLARGDTKSAESICLELIRQEPSAYEPYVTLSQIYESSHVEKSMEFLTIAAHLYPRDVSLWLRLAQYYIEENANCKKAVKCLSKAIKAQPKNYSLYSQRISILEKLNDYRNIYRCKMQLLHMYSERHVNEILCLALELANYHRNEKEYQKAIDAVNVPFTKCRKHVTVELVNIFLDVLLLNENYPQVLDVCLQFCNIEMEITVDENNKVNVLSYTMPENVPIDLKTKFMTCLIKLSAYKLVATLVDSLLDDPKNVENHGDLFLDLAEAFMSMKRYEEALRLLIPLTKDPNFGLAAVWMRHSECLRECAKMEEAIGSYYEVLKRTPDNLEVKRPLAELLVARGRVEEALQVLDQRQDNASNRTVDVSLLMKQITLLQEQNKMVEYFECVELMLKRHCISFAHYYELSCASFLSTVPEKIAQINKFRDLKNIPHITFNIASIKEPSIEEEYSFYRKIMNDCYVQGHYKQLKLFAFYGLTSTRFKAYVPDITIAAFYACLLTKDTLLAYPILRELLLRNFRDPKLNNKLWNLLISAHQGTFDERQSKFVMRLRKLKKCSFMKIIDACFALSSGSCKFANIQLIPFLKSQPTPFVYLLLGVSFSIISLASKTSSVHMRKNRTLCSFAFFANYASKRGKLAAPEVWYNLGRMNQHFGMSQVAVHYYRLVLEFSHTLYEEYEEILDLKQAAAYNLSVIYRESENYVGARNIMMKYLTI